ncbi:MAG: complex I subunit 5 family protein [Candidatus Odinarchaeum yellowstonii]|uniref:Complex I subunit 5 family protein n=1 Tax=Odinarchaeota yellowstonii (strain LCB_4) TaxID=1841599 RepID=A0AAF0D203_ODILC|nr:MAG: complex I subunit 5 family protein [Candidatus Odinarchaeum yellowstonii]
MIEVLLVVCFFTPLIAAVIVTPLQSAWSKSYKVVLLAATFISLIVSILMIPSVILQSTIIQHPLLPMNVKPENMSILLSITIVAFLSSLYNFAAEKGGRLSPHVYSIFILLLLGVMLGLILFYDIVILYILVETTIGVTVILVTHTQGKFALQAAFKYLIITAISAILFLAGVIILFNLTGDFSIYSLYDKAAALQANPKLSTLAVALIVAGLGADIGIVPFHGWLPDAVPASPDTVNSYVSVEGVPLFYALYKIAEPVYLAYSTPYMIGLLISVGVASILLGNLTAYRQKDYMRMIAYSCIDIYGHTALILGLFSPAAYTAGFFYLINASIIKMCLFQNLGVVTRLSNTTNMDQLSGLARRLKKTSYIYLAGLISITGIPPFAGFYGKFLVYNTLYSFIAYSNIILAAFTVAGLAAVSLVTLAYYVNSYHRIFLGALEKPVLNVSEPHILMWLPAAIGVALSLIIGLQPQILLAGLT